MNLPDCGLKVTSDIVFQYVFSSTGSEPGLLGLINAVQMDAGRPPAAKIEIILLLFEFFIPREHVEPWCEAPTAD